MQLELWSITTPTDAQSSIPPPPPFPLQWEAAGSGVVERGLLAYWVPAALLGSI